MATPVGISGAVLLLPFQVSVLGTPSPAVTPTNLLYNVVSTPGAVYQYWRQHQTGGPLALLLMTGTLPGVIAGSVIRVELVPGPRVFDLLVAALLLPLGTWLAATRPDRPRDPARSPWPRRIPAPVLIVLAALTGCVGGTTWPTPGWPRACASSPALICRAPALDLRLFLGVAGVPCPALPQRHRFRRRCRVLLPAVRD